MFNHLWLTDKFKEKTQVLYNLLNTKDFNAELLRAQLDTGNFSTEDINLAALRYIYALYADHAAYHHLFEHLAYGEMLPGIKSSHLVDTIRILLEHGLEPNTIMVSDRGEQTNNMKQILSVHNGYQAADAIAEMIEHGGNPNLIIEGTSLIPDFSWMLLYSLRYDKVARYWSDSVVHSWLVLIGYGAILQDGRESIDPVGDFDISNFRNHRQYYYGVIHSDRSIDGLEVCFFDKDTNWEVARYCKER